MKRREQTAPGPVKKVTNALAQPATPQARPNSRSLDVSEGFRSARSSLGQITADLERLRQHAATLVKGAHRPAK
jgi:hypothetical protein